MLTPDQIPALTKAMANTGRVLIIGTKGSDKMSATKNALLDMTSEYKVDAMSVDSLFEQPALLNVENSLIVLTDATYALMGESMGDSEAFLRFMSIAQRRGYKAIVVAPVELDSYDSHAAQYCMNVRIS